MIINLFDSSAVGGAPRMGGVNVNITSSRVVSHWINRVKQIAVQYNSEMVLLNIITHSVGVQLADGSVHHGGNGIQFGTVAVYIDLLDYVFPPLRDWLDRIDLYACSSAVTNYTGDQWGRGDGKAFCRRLASLVDCPVRAADADQTFDGASGTITWTGNVYEFSPQGAISLVQAAPPPPPEIGYPDYPDNNLSPF